MYIAIAGSAINYFRLAAVTAKFFWNRRRRKKKYSASQLAKRHFQKNSA